MKLETRFAPPEREELWVVLKQHERFKTLHSVDIMQALPVPVMVLNQRRQLVFGNRKLEQALGVTSLERVLGRRPGEIFDCIHSRRMAAGCGTSEFCRGCGAVRVILSAVKGRTEVQECRMLRNTPNGVEALELEVSSSPLTVDGESCAIFSVLDVSHERRRRALERVFFHDVVNLAGALSGLSTHLAEEAPTGFKGQVEVLGKGINDLLEEILSQKDLLAAESNELDCEPGLMSPWDVVQTVAHIYSRHPAAAGRRVAASCKAGDTVLETDGVILGRVLGNMAKNAIEASRQGETVAVCCDLDEDGIRFSVHNPGCIPPDDQLKIFSRSFTTKGAGRGLGTYSIKLLTERYLQGEAGFTSTEADGTTFFIRLPLVYDRSLLPKPEDESA